MSRLGDMRYRRTVSQAVAAYEERGVHSPVVSLRRLRTNLADRVHMANTIGWPALAESFRQDLAKIDGILAKVAA